jgi:hypothetical protein
MSLVQLECIAGSAKLADCFPVSSNLVESRPTSTHVLSFHQISTKVAATYVFIGSSSFFTATQLRQDIHLLNGEGKNADPLPMLGGLFYVSSWCTGGSNVHILHHHLLFCSWPYKQTSQQDGVTRVHGQSNCSSSHSSPGYQYSDPPRLASISELFLPPVTVASDTVPSAHVLSGYVPSANVPLGTVSSGGVVPEMEDRSPRWKIMTVLTSGHPSPNMSSS